MTIDFEKCGGLVPAIIQDADTQKVLMLGYMNQQAYEKTILEAVSVLDLVKPAAPASNPE